MRLTMIQLASLLSLFLFGGCATVSFKLVRTENVVPYGEAGKNTGAYTRDGVSYTANLTDNEGKFDLDLVVLNSSSREIQINKTKFQVDSSDDNFSWVQRYKYTVPVASSILAVTAQEQYDADIENLDKVVTQSKINPNGIYRYRLPAKPKSGGGNEVVADSAEASPMAVIAARSRWAKTMGFSSQESKFIRFSMTDEYGRTVLFVYERVNG